VLESIRFLLTSLVTCLPREYSQDLTADEIGKPMMEVTLEKGDLLYFPRGTHQPCRTLRSVDLSTVRLLFARHDSRGCVHG
jgi:ribosomal protein L16 Arg81 hydroxylase